MGLSPNGILLIVSTMSVIGLGVAFVFMPSDESKMERLERMKNKKYLGKGEDYIHPEVLKKMKDKEKSGQQLMDAIKNAANSEHLFFGRKDNKKD